MAMVVVLLMVRVILLVQMDHVLDVASLRHNEDMSIGADHVDFRSVKPRQNRCGHHLLDGTERGPSATEVEHTVEGAQQLVQLVGAEQNCDTTLATEAPNEVYGDLLVVRIETDQWLVEK